MKLTLRLISIGTFLCWAFSNTLVAEVHRSPRPSPGRYIVRLHDAASSRPDLVAAEFAKTFSAQPLYIFRGRPWDGFVLVRLPAEAAEAIARDPRVDFVEEDGVGELLQVQPGWGLDRVNQTALPLDGVATNDCLKGAGVRIYVADTGITASDEFGGRLINLWSKNDNFNDVVNHGTSVAAIIGGNTWGVARGVTLVNVKIIAFSNNQDTASDAIEAIRNHINPDAFAGPKIVNMSVKYPASQSLRDVITDSVITYGITYVVGAGNEGLNACFQGTPADMGQADGVITVGASTIDPSGPQDRRSDHPGGDGVFGAWSSNTGACVDVFAPGTLVDSIGNDSAWRRFSGTSAATPYASGVAARHAQSYFSTYSTPPSPAYAEGRLKMFANAGLLDPSTLGTDSPNLLLYQYSARCR